MHTHQAAHRGGHSSASRRMAAQTCSRPKYAPAASCTRATASTLCAEESWRRMAGRSSLAAPAPPSRCALPSMGAAGKAPTARSTAGSVARAGDPGWAAKASHACTMDLACDAVRTAGPVLLLCSAVAVPAAARSSSLAARSCSATLSCQPLSLIQSRTVATAPRLRLHGSRGSRDSSAAARSSSSALLGLKPCLSCKTFTNKANSDSSEPLQPGSWPRALST